VTFTRLSLLWVGIAVAAAVPACRCRGVQQPKVKEPPRSVAVVNGEPITADVFQVELQHSRAETGEDDGPLEAVRKRVLEEMVDRTLLLQQARARSIVVTQDQIEHAFLKVRSDYPSTHFDDLLAEERLSAAGLKARLKDQLTVEKLFAEEVFPQVSISDEEVQRFYQEHPAEFEQPERVHVLQVVVQSEDEARRIRDELRRSPGSFAAVAKRSSIAPEGKAGGDLGYFGKESGMPEIFDLCFRLGLNTISEVTPSPYGFHIFKVVDRKPAGHRPFEQARDEIRQRLLRERRARAQQEYLAALRQRAQIKIDWTSAAAVNP
jgi:peptidyl-prolyl cis-trans isomerase C